jgi:hypothetical protein
MNINIGSVYLMKITNNLYLLYRYIMITKYSEFPSLRYSRGKLLVSGSFAKIWLSYDNKRSVKIAMKIVRYLF